VGDSPVAGLNRDADQLTVAATLFDEDAGLVRRTGYLVFWSNMLHHLAGWRAEPLTLSPVQADRSTDTASTAVALNADMGNFAFTADGGAASVERGDTRPTVWQWLLTAALGLMVVEAVLNIRGRIS